MVRGAFNNYVEKIRWLIDGQDCILLSTCWVGSKKGQNYVDVVNECPPYSLPKMKILFMYNISQKLAAFSYPYVGSCRRVLHFNLNSTLCYTY